MIKIVRFTQSLILEFRDKGYFNIQFLIAKSSAFFFLIFKKGKPLTFKTNLQAVEKLLDLSQVGYLAYGLNIATTKLFEKHISL